MLEVVVGSFAMTLFGPAVVAAVVSTIVVRSVLGDEPVYRVAPFRVESLVEFVPFLLIGVLGGFASAGFVRALASASACSPPRSSRSGRPWPWAARSSA